MHAPGDLLLTGAKGQISQPTNSGTQSKSFHLTFHIEWWLQNCSSHSRQLTKHAHMQMQKKHRTKSSSSSENIFVWTDLKMFCDDNMRCVRFDFYWTQYRRYLFRSSFSAFSAILHGLVPYVCNSIATM